MAPPIQYARTADGVSRMALLRSVLQTLAYPNRFGHSGHTCAQAAVKPCQKEGMR
jgi:hypothetical protein